MKPALGFQAARTAATGFADVDGDAPNVLEAWAFLNLKAFQF